MQGRVVLAVLMAVLVAVEQKLTVVGRALAALSALSIPVQHAPSHRLIQGISNA
jgi:hypothetical protein